jgi:hypothetical protein
MTGLFLVAQPHETPRAIAAMRPPCRPGTAGADPLSADAIVSMYRQLA